LSEKFSLDGLPAAIKPPVSLSTYCEVLARGVQIYACARNEKGERVWLHKGPEAELFDAAGEPFGKHYGGPSWEGPDGGKVVGALKASVPAPNAGDIPWLLLDIKSRGGAGVFTEAKAILRIATFGGVPPVEPCNDANDGRIVRVPYQAAYVFLK
jgi:hypothetical protein